MLRTTALLGTLFVTLAAAQSRPAWDGAFTAAEAERGRAHYRESCARCHGQELAGGESSPPLAGSGFLGQWTGKSALDLLDRIRRTMPSDNPGGLGSRQYTDIVAYILSANRFHPGAGTMGQPAGAATATAGRTTAYNKPVSRTEATSPRTPPAASLHEWRPLAPRDPRTRFPLSAGIRLPTLEHGTHFAADIPGFAVLLRRLRAARIGTAAAGLSLGTLWA